ncbi:MAG: fumarylacetoacetate hydrolase family protein [Lysobacteraceae bacterium]
MNDDAGWVIQPHVRASLVVRGSAKRFAIHRIYCVGRNFADHAREMGHAAPASPEERGTPVFFSKPADVVVTGEATAAIPYPRETADLHHEVELVLALGRDSDGVIAREDAASMIFGHAVGIDLTRRDLQALAKANGLPWDTAKGFDASAPISELVPLSVATPQETALLQLEVNGDLRQSAPLSDMIFDVADVLHHLSRFYNMRAGDLVFMGTPAGVAALQRGDRFIARVEGLVELNGAIAD